MSNEGVFMSNEDEVEDVIVVSRDEFKSFVKRLRVMLKVQHGLELGHSQVLDFASRCLGFKDWNTCSPKLGDKETIFVIPKNTKIFIRDKDLRQTLIAASKGDKL